MQGGANEGTRQRLGCVAVLPFWQAVAAASRFCGAE